MDNLAAYRLTAVVTAAPTGDLVDLATFKDDWDIGNTTHDAFLSRSITRCSAAISNYCNRVFGAATYRDSFRLDRTGRVGCALDGSRNPLSLSQSPVSQILSVTLQYSDGSSDTLVQGIDFEVNLATGQIYRLDADTGLPMDWSPVQTVVVFQAGFLLPAMDAASYPGVASLPLDIEDAAGRMVFSRYSERSRDPYLKRIEDPRVGIKEYWIGTTPGSEGAMTPDVADILDNYRVPLVG